MEDFHLCTLFTKQNLSCYPLFAMVPLSIMDSLLKVDVILQNGEGVSITFVIHNNRYAIDLVLCLNFRFQLNESSLRIDEEIYDIVTGDLSNINGPLLICYDNSKHWLLKPRRFRLYSFSRNVMVASTRVVTPYCSYTSTMWTLLSLR
jgi:hypothetical protein